jgi:exonuclease SbcD
LKAVIAAVPFLRDRDVRVGKAGETLEEIQADLIAGIQSVYDSVAAAAKAHAGQNIPVIGTGHLTTLGSSSSDSELAIHVGGLGAFPSSGFSESFNYVALGHLHRPQKADAAGRIRYSGSPIPLSFSESGDSKAIEFLELENGRLTKQESIPIPQQRGLLRLCCNAQEVRDYLIGYSWPTYPLGCLVELTINNLGGSSVSLDAIRDLLVDKSVQILQIRTVDRSRLAEMKDDGATVEEAIRFLQNEPREVFAQRLEATDYSPETKQRLCTAFDMLLEDVMTAIHDK